jgi:hypothetical protein
MGFLMLFVIGVLDYFSGSEISLSLVYVFPIALIARVGDWKYGLISAIVSAVIWLSVEILVGTPYSHPAILYWNGFVRLSMFLLMAYSIKLGRSLEREAIMARTDFLTGVASLVPGAWDVRNAPSSALSRAVLTGIIGYLFLSSIVDFFAYTQSIVNTASIPSIAFRIVLGIAILFLALKGHDKK